MDPLFAPIALVCIGSALMVVTRTNPVYSAVWLLVCFLSFAVIYLRLSAPFLAAIHVGDVRGENTASGWYAPANGVPEPSTLILFGLGAGFIALRKRR